MAVLMVFMVMMMMMVMTVVVMFRLVSTLISRRLAIRGITRGEHIRHVDAFSLLWGHVATAGGGGLLRT